MMRIEGNYMCWCYFKHAVVSL